MKQELEIMAEVANNVGIKNFKTLFNEYCKLLKKSKSSMIINNYIDVDFKEIQEQFDSETWCCDERGITGVDKFGGEVIACLHPILPILKFKNVDTGITKVKLAFKTYDKWETLIVDKRTISSANSIVELSSNNISVSSENAKTLVKYLQDIEHYNRDKIPIMNSIARLGWIEDFGFSPYVENLIFDGDQKCGEKYKSIKEKGSFDIWLKTVKEIRQSGITARILLASSFSSVLVEKVGGLPFFVHMYGGTEVGKTVGLMLASSVWGNPDNKHGYMETLNNTNFFIEKLATFFNNMPLIMDELQLIQKEKNFDYIIYSLTEGKGKGRGNKNGGMDISGTWKNCIITSGEHSILNSNSGGGAVNRIIEVECKEKLFNNPRNLVETIKDNYGFAGKIFVEWLSEKDNISKAKEIFEDYITLFDKEDTTDKQMMAISFILTADKLVTDLIFKDDKELKVIDVIEFLKTKKEVDVNFRAYEHVYQIVVANSNKFSDSVLECWGSLDNDYFYIMSYRFNEICKENGFNPQSTLRWMKANDKIRATKGNTESKWINGSSTHCVCIKKISRHEFQNKEIVYDDKLPF